MLISSCLKMQLGRNPVTVDSFTSSNFQDAIDSVIGSNVDDLTVFSHLSALFSGNTDWHYPLAIVTPKPTDTFIGFVVDSISAFGHPTNSLSLACHKSQTAKNQIARNVPRINGDEIMSSSEWSSLIQSTEPKDLNAVIQQVSSGVDYPMTFFNTPITLKIMRCNASDILSLPRLLDPDYPPYTDAFDKVKSCLANNIAVLNNDRFATAVYHEVGDYIILTADCYIQTQANQQEEEVEANPSYFRVSKIDVLGV